MNKVIKNLILASTATIVFLGAAFFILYSYTGVVDAVVVGLLNHFTRENVRIDYRGMSGNIWGTIRLDGVEIYVDDDSLFCEQVKLNYSLIDVLKQEFQVKRLNLVNPVIKLRMNAEPEKPDPEPLQLSLDSLKRKLDLVKFPVIRLQQLKLENGEVRIYQSSETEIIKNIHLTLAAEVQNEKVQCVVEHISGSWENRGIELENIFFELWADKRSFALEKLNGSCNYGSVSGQINLLLDDRLAAAFSLDLNEIKFAAIKETFWENCPFQSGKINLRGIVACDADSLDGRLWSHGNLDEFKIDFLKTHFEGNRSTLLLDSLQFQSDFGKLKGSMLLSSQKNNKINLEISRLNLQKIGVWKKKTDITGNIDLDFDSRDIEHLSGSGQIRLSPLQIDSIRIDTLFIDVAARDGNWQLLKSSRIKCAADTEVFLRGNLSAEQKLDLKVKVYESDFEPVFSNLGIAEAGGFGSVNVQLNGNINDPSLQADISCDSLKFKNIVVYGVEGDAEIDNIFKKRFGIVDLKIGTGYLGNIFLTDGKIKCRFEENKMLFESFHFDSKDNSISLRPYISLNEDGTYLKLQGFEARYQNYFIKTIKPIELTYSQDTLNIESCLLETTDAGLIQLAGFLAFNGKSHAELEIDDIRIAPFNQYLNWAPDLNGYIKGEAEFSGTFSNPSILLGISLKDLSIYEHQIGSLESELVLKDRRLSINYFNFERNSTSFLTLNGTMDIALDKDIDQRSDFMGKPLGMNVVLENLRLEDFSPLIQVNYPVKGAISGRLEVAGSVARPQANLVLTGDEVRIGEYYFPEFKVDSKVDASKIYVDWASVNFMNTMVYLRGEKRILWDPRNPQQLFSNKDFSLRVSIEEDSLNFLNTIHSELDRLIGDVRMDVLLEGAYDQPKVAEADITVKNGRLFLSKLENSFDDISLKAHLEGNELKFDKFSAWSSGAGSQRSFFSRLLTPFQKLISLGKKRQGKIEGKGSIDLADLKRPGINLEFSFENAYINYFLENTELVVSSDKFRIFGRDTLNLVGDLLIQEGDVEFDFEESEKNTLFSVNVRDEAPFLQYNLGIDILPNFYLRSNAAFNAFNMQLSGNLQIVQKPRSPMEIYGVLETKGKYSLQRGEDFEIQNGVIRFSESGEMPNVNIFSKKRKNKYLFELTVKGPLDRPDKHIQVKDSNGEVLTQYNDFKDQMALLVFGVDFEELRKSETDSLLFSKGRELFARAAITTMEDKARALTGLDQFRFESEENIAQNGEADPNSGTSAGNNPGSNIIRQTANKNLSTLSLGKYLTPNLYFEYRSKLKLADSGAWSIPRPQLSWEAGNHIFLEYRLNHNWSFSTTFQKTWEGNDQVQLDINWKVSF